MLQWHKLLCCELNNKILIFVRCSYTWSSLSLLIMTRIDLCGHDVHSFNHLHEFDILPSPLPPRPPTSWCNKNLFMWSESTRIMVNQMNRWILVQSGFIGSLFWSTMVKVISDHWSWSESFQRNTAVDFPTESMGVFLWDDRDQDQWSEITRILLHQMNWWILSQRGFFGSFEVLHVWSDHWSWSGWSQWNAAYMFCFLFYFCFTVTVLRSWLVQILNAQNAELLPG